MEKVLVIVFALLLGGVSAAQNTSRPTSQSVPPSVALPLPVQGVPPTPAPAFPGLVNQPGATPSTSGIPGPITNDARTPLPLPPASVATAQSLLSANGFYRGPIDGLLNGPTRASVRAFQETARIPATGELDAETAALLGLPQNAAVPTPTTTAGTATTPTQPVQDQTISINAGVAAYGRPAPMGAPTTATPPAGTTARGTAGETPFPLSTPPQPPPYPTPPIFIQP